MKHSKLITAVAIVLVGLMVSSTTLATSRGNTVIRGVFSNRGDLDLSGSGHTIFENCGVSSGNQTATLNVKQRGGTSKVEIEVSDARPYTLYTVWLRVTGIGPASDIFGPSPMTGAGATPLAPSYALDNLIYNSPALLPAGTPNSTNGFTTDVNGDANFEIDLDFPVVGGSYPFQNASDEAVQALIDAGSGWPLVRIPSPIANPEDPNISAAWLMRIMSHCLDQRAHGLSPGVREAWFDYP